MNALTPKEVKIIHMALETFIEDMTAASKNVKFNFNPEARIMQRDMLESAKSGLAKIQLASGYAVRLDPYNEGDEKEFLTKQS